jgi:hypothetical protein
MLLLALPHYPRKVSDIPTPDDTVIGNNLNTSNLFGDDKATCTAKGRLQQLPAPECYGRKGYVSAANYFKGPCLHGAKSCASKALNKAFEKEWMTPDSSAPSQHPESQSRTFITSNSAFATVGMQPVPPITKLTTLDEALRRECGAECTSTRHCSGVYSFSGLGCHHASSHASTLDTPIPTLVKSAKMAPVKQVPGVMAGKVWLALTRALMVEVRKLRNSSQKELPDCKLLLSSMLQRFSEDVLWSPYLRSAAAEAVALSTSAPLEHSTGCTCNEIMHPPAASRYSSSQDGQAPNRAYMSIFQARGFMHAVGQPTSTTSAARLKETASLQMQGTEDHHTGVYRKLGVLEERNCNVGSIHGVVKRTAVQDASQTATLEKLPHQNSRDVLKWREVCIRSS